MAPSNTSTRIHRLLVLSCVSYLASHASSPSFDYGGWDYPTVLSRHGTSLPINNTVTLGIFSVPALNLCRPALPHNPGVNSFAIRRGSSITRPILNTTENHVDACIEDLREKQQFSNCSSMFFYTIFPYVVPRTTYRNWASLSPVPTRYILRLCSGSVQDASLSGMFQSDTQSGLSFLLASNNLPEEPARARKLLSGTYGRSTTTHDAAIHEKVPSTLLKQVSIAASTLFGLICTVAGLVLCCIHSKRRLQSIPAIELENELRRELGPKEFVHGELAAATDNFAEERKIGRGGFGPVYRGYLTDQDRQVAIKVLSQELSVQGLKEFQAEVTIMSQLRHRNIVRLVGWCGRRRELALVYELVPGGSLDTHLYNPDRHLTWTQRYKIALQLGSALRYLHTDCDQCVVHGDIKPANVMLDASLNAKLGDFGLARFVDHGAEPQTTQVVAGTVGYIDPEFVSSRRPSVESDVYSFGVVLLEIACGRRPTPSRQPDQAASAALLASVRDMYRRNVVLEAVDRKLDGEFDGLQMERMLVTGLWCAHHDPVQRPSVAQAVDVLRSEDPELPVLGAMGGSVEIHNWEGQAYGDLSAENSAYLDACNETAYLTTEDSVYRLQM